MFIHTNNENRTICHCGTNAEILVYKYPKGPIVKTYSSPQRKFSFSARLILIRQEGPNPRAGFSSRFNGSDKKTKTKKAAADSDFRAIKNVVFF